MASGNSRKLIDYPNCPISKGVPKVPMLSFDDVSANGTPKRFYFAINALSGYGIVRRGHTPGLEQVENKQQRLKSRPYIS